MIITFTVFIKVCTFRGGVNSKGYKTVQEAWGEKLTTLELTCLFNDPYFFTTENI